LLVHLEGPDELDEGDAGKLDRLREKERAGALTAAEQPELAALMAEVEAEEAQALAPAMTRLRDDVEALAQEVRGVESRNEELARLLAQQQQLAADAHRFLAEFDQRRATILDALARVAGGPLPAT
jgi:DNA repair exonuclease SbcCD ATPase subunit